MKHASNRTQKGQNGLFKGVMMAHLILLLHGLLAAGLLVVVLFFRGLINYAGWILLGGTVLVLVIGYGIYRRIKREGRSLKEFLNSPLFRGKTIEVSILGGMASLKVGQSDPIGQLEASTHPDTPRLEDPERIRVRELSELARLLENQLITQDEFNRAKSRILHP